ncbi:acetamidase/formamidase family protein [Acidisoma sp. C75]
MAILRFTTDPFPLDRRHAAWSEALRGIGLSLSAPGEGPPPMGRLLHWQAPRGTAFSLLATDAQGLGRLGETGAEILLLGLLLSGTARLESGAPLGPRDLLCWPMGPGPLLRPGVPCRLFLLHLPRRDPRWAALAEGLAETAEPLRLADQPVLAGLLSTIGDALDSGTEAVLSALETALGEILPTILGALSGGTAQRAALRQRILAAIERRLAEPHLNLSRFAAEEGMSERAVQKLLEGEGRSFSQHLRHRRLTRAADALRDPTQAALAVAEIGFRCGFEDPTHFSRAFRQRFGLSPAQHRAQGEAAASAPAPLRSRGRPQAGAKVPAPPPPASAQASRPSATGPAHHHLRARPETIHWGYFSRALAPALTVRSGDTVTVETLTQHASDDPARMILGDADAEAVFHWTAERKAVDRRGAGPLDASIYGRGAGEGFGVHILTGPIAVEAARPRDVLEVEILAITPRPSRAPGYEGRSFGSNAAVWWGRHYDELLTGPRPREVVTLYEVLSCGNRLCAHAEYSFRWTPQRDPSGVLHPTIDYPGVPVDPSTIERLGGVLAGVHVPVRPHFGTIGLAPDHPGLLDSVPPSAFGGNIDNWRLGAGTRIFLPVSVPGALLSLGDPHAAQGDGEVAGTAIECSMTGELRLTLHPRETAGPMLRDLSYPLIETEEHWIIQGFSHPDYLADFGETAQSEVYKRSSLDAAMRDAFRKARRFLMTAQTLTEDEAISLLSVAVDFGITQVVDGNWGVHASIPKALFQP